MKSIFKTKSETILTHDLTIMLCELNPPTVKDNSAGVGVQAQV